MDIVISNELGVMQLQSNMTTLKDRISVRVKHRTKPGPKGFLTPQEDQELA